LYSSNMSRTCWTSLTALLLLLLQFEHPPLWTWSVDLSPQSGGLNLLQFACKLYACHNRQADQVTCHMHHCLLSILRTAKISNDWIDLKLAYKCLSLLLRTVKFDQCMRLPDVLFQIWKYDSVCSELSNGPMGSSRPLLERYCLRWPMNQAPSSPWNSCTTARQSYWPSQDRFF
jgi:hypothetical protein